MNKKQPDDGVERPDDAPLVAEPESFGTWLRRQREVREIDLREIADASKVSMSYLRALEEDRFDVLPAPVFAKGFLRQYARYVGLDPEETVNFYLAARHPEGEEEPALQPRMAPEPPPRNYFLIGLAVVVVLVLVVWLLSKLSQRVPSDAAAPVATPALQPASPPTADAAEAPAVAAPGVERPAAEPEPSLPEEVEEPLPPLRVTLDFMSDCWVEASVDGAERFSELKVQGESLLLDAQEFVEFKVGDVGAVQVEVNGKPYEIASRQGTSVRNVRIDLAAAAAVVENADARSSPSSEGPSGSSNRQVDH